MAYAFNDDKGKYDLDENVLGGASNTLYDAELAIAENAADIAALSELIRGKTIEISASVAANATGTAGFTSIPSIAGYKPVCIVGFNNSAWELPIATIYFNNETKNIYWAVSNPSKEARNFTLHVILLYIKDGYFYTNY